jgi:hypothetical protein
MLFRLLDALREKPAHIRRQYAFGLAVMFTLLVGGVWSFTLPARFLAEAPVAEIPSATTPFASLWNTMKDQFGTMKQQATAIVASTTASSTATSTASTSDMFDALTLVSTSTPPAPKPQPILIGTTSATVSTENSIE